MEKGNFFQVQLGRLATQQSVLEHQIDSLTSLPLYDQLAVQRLKRLKLEVVAQIKKIKSSILPDIIA